MKEETRNIENMLVSAYRGAECPLAESLQRILFGELERTKRSRILDHVKGCGYCRNEIKALTQISELPLPAEFLGYNENILTTIAQKAQNIIRKIMPRELPDFPSLWQTALKGDYGSAGDLPLAAATFSQASTSRSTLIIRALLLLGSNPEPLRLDSVSKLLKLTSEERKTLKSELF